MKIYEIQIDHLNRISKLLTLICDTHTIIYNDIKWYYKGIELCYPYPTDNKISRLQTVLEIYLEFMDNIILTGESAKLTQEHMILLNEYWKEYWKLNYVEISHKYYSTITVPKYLLFPKHPLIVTRI